MSLFVTIPFVKQHRLRMSCCVALLGLAFGLSVGGDAHSAQGDAALPVRNLLIEWRVNALTQSQKTQQGIRNGQLIVDSRGQIIGRTGIGASYAETEQRGVAVQQIQVINGGWARLFVGETRPHLVWQWAWLDAGRSAFGAHDRAPQVPGTPAGSHAPTLMSAQTVWLDIGQGLHVRPRWPGGHAPVLVELEAQSRQPGIAGGGIVERTEPDGQTRRFDVGSTLSVPMGEWAVVARSGSQSRQQQAGALSTSALDNLESEQLEIRITAP